jgi:hypothetical protein
VLPAPENLPEHGADKVAAMLRKMCSYKSSDRFLNPYEVISAIREIENECDDENPTEDFEEFATEYLEDDVSEAENVPGEETERKQTRRERKLLEEEANDRLFQTIRKSYFLWGVLFFLILESYFPDKAFLSDWRFWMFPLSFFVITLVTFSYMSEVIVIGTVLWVIQVATGWLPFLKLLSKYELGWISVCLFVGIWFDMVSQCLYHPGTKKMQIKARGLWQYMVLNALWLVLVIAGIVCMILGVFKICEVPEVLSRLHLILMGAGIYIVEYISMRRLGIMNEMGEIRELMDGQ